jgi:hypothetical protein
MKPSTFASCLATVATLIALSALAGAARAADPKPIEPGPWKIGEVVSLNLSQSSFSTNWSGGDQGSLVWVLGSATTAERQFTKRFNLSDALTLAYGQTTRQQNDPSHPGQRVWSTPDKTTDQLLFESVGRFTLDAWADPYFALRAESQFKDQSSPLGTLTLNPVKLKESAGIARVLFKTDDREAITRLGFGFRQTMARQLLSAVPKTTTSFTSNDGGFEWQTNVKQPLLQKKVLWTGSLLVFQPIFFSGANDLKAFDRAVRDSAAGYGLSTESVADFWRAPDVNLQNTFAAQITKSISVNLVTQLVYDKFDATAKVDNTRPLLLRVPAVYHNIRKAGQFRETLALGFTYRMF